MEPFNLVNGLLSYASSLCFSSLCKKKLNSSKKNKHKDEKMASQKQLKEAEAFFKEGKALLKRTITRWSPDFDGAATKFEKAANAYRNLKMIKESYDAYKEAANAHYSAGKYVCDWSCIVVITN